MQWWYWNDSCIHNSIFTLNDCRVACHGQRFWSDWKLGWGDTSDIVHQDVKCRICMSFQNAFQTVCYSIQSLSLSNPIECLKPFADAFELSSLNPNRIYNPKTPRRRLKQMPKWELPRFNEFTLVHYLQKKICKYKHFAFATKHMNGNISFDSFININNSNYRLPEILKLPFLRLHSIVNPKLY